MTEEAVKNGDAHNGNSNTKTVSFSALKPQLFVEQGKVGDAVHFYKAAFGAQEISHGTQSKRKADQELPSLISAELKLGSSIFIISEHSSDLNKTAGSGLSFLLETEDIESAVANAVKAGAVSDGEIEEGDNAMPMGKVKDPYGMMWAITSPTIVKKMKKSEEENVEAA
ncbi:Early tobacco anther 1 [Heracleum sosnowskyi]|uniref:Early tobacco anther 1 n=1 Tax=Heracleum sosnowskyi TaxID=360622 RepID=A0AAD8GS83_9APIA|nr:Early tobacco anther 1 [Heracleum sosnowskyi]